MALFSLADIITAIFLLVVVVDALQHHDERKSSKALTLTLIVSVIMVLIDSLSGNQFPSTTPDALLYLAAALTAIATKVIMLFFCLYCYQYFVERGPISKWLFFIPMALIALLILAQAVMVLSGVYVTVSNGAIAAGSVPAIIDIPCIVLALYFPILAIIKRKSIGANAVFLVGAFNIFLILLPLAGLHDYNTCCGAIIMFIAYVLLQNGISNQRELERQVLEADKAELETLNSQLERNQAQLEESVSEQEAQLEEIAALNTQLEINKHELEEALTGSRESSAMLNEVHEILGSAPWRIEYDEAGKTETKAFFSDGFRHLFGFENKEDFPDSLEFMLSRVHPADIDQMLKEIYAVIRCNDKNNNHISYTYRGYRKDKSLRWYHVQGITKRREDGTAELTYGVAQDITNLEAAKSGQKEALEAFEAIHDAIGSAYWQMTFDEQGNMNSCTWSNRFRRMIGYHTEEDFPNELSSWTDLLHPADKKMTLKAYWDSVNDRTGKTVYSVEYRLLTRTKGYRWYSAHGSLSRYPDGRPKVFYGIFQDVNDQILSAQSQEANIKEITELNKKLEDNQAELVASAEEQESQMEEIAALNTQLQENQARLEEVSAEQEAQLEETQALNQELQESKDRISEAYGMVEGLSSEYHTIWLVNKETSKMRLIRSSGKSTIQNAVQMGKDLPEFDKGFEKYINTYVEPEDRVRMHREIAFAEILRHLSEQPEALYAVNYLRRDDSGHVGYHQIAFANADTQDGKKQFVYGFRDIDKIVKEEQSQKEELRKAKEDAESANAAKTSFLFNMSHDIRTPMNAIMGFRDLLEKHQEEPEKRQDYLDKIHDASTVLLSIINNVLEMARIEKGTLAIEETAWSTEQFNDTLFSVFHVMMEEKGLTFTRQIEVQHHYVYCDPTKLREIFINILSNAYKYTNAGGKVNMHLEEIPCDREGWVLYRTTISDNGIGMSEDFLPHIFEEFAREQNTTDAKVEGTGLGMPIVKRLVEMLGGTIEVKSKKGEGSTFIVTIPHRIADKANLVDHAGVEIDPKLFEGKHILLAEDNDLNAEIAMEILDEAGFIVDRAEDGRICFDMLKKAEEGYYDLILMDIQMPNMNGYEATKVIRQMEDHDKASIKILAMTANAFEEDRREALKAGMNGHLAKPINVNELMKTLSMMLG